MSNENKSEEVLAVEKSFTDNFECAFSIDEYNRTPDIEAIAIHTDLPMDFDVACDSEEQKEIILKSLTDLSKHFDFSFNLDFEDVDELVSFTESIM